MAARKATAKVQGRRARPADTRRGDRRPSKPILGRAAKGSVTSGEIVGVGVVNLVKNTLAKRALKGTSFEVLSAHFEGTTAVAYTESDPVALAKALTVYAKTNPTFTFKAGMVEGRVIDLSGITALATLPSKEEIFSKLLYVINAPAQQLVTVLNAVGRNLAVVVDQGVKENKFSA